MPDGSSVPADLIVWCTGYRVSFPFRSLERDEDAPPDVEGILVPELAVELGAAGDRVLQIEGIRGIHIGADMGDAVVADLVETGVDVPVVAVPTSTGQPGAFGGLGALMTMLNSAAPGVAVTNIDNGYSAGVFAARVARRSARRD